MAVRSPQDVYARHVSSPRGYPMWTPEPSSQLLSYRPEGLRIGDVGVVVPENGNFDVFFNICLPKDHHFHKATGVPDGFSPVELSDADIKTVPNVESAGQIITASSVTRRRSATQVRLFQHYKGTMGVQPLHTNRTLDRVGQSGATGYTFNLSSSEGALLILPEGAECHDVRDPRPFFEQASRHAATWYHFAEENLGRIISHDSIYVITGFHKARSWGLAGYQNEKGNSDFSARFTVGTREGGNLAANYNWETTRSMDWRVGPFDGLGIANQSVFIRGFKIALRSSVQGVPQRWVSFEPSRPSGRSDHGTSSGDSWLASAWRGISKTVGISSEGADRGVGRDSRENAGVRIEIQRVPEILPVFHPSDVINRYILQKDLLKLEELAQAELLTKAVSERYTIVSREGVAYLQSERSVLARWLKPDLNVTHSDSDASIDATANNFSPTEAAKQAPIDGVDAPTKVKGESEVVQPSHPESLSVVSESNYRCVDGSASKSIAESIPSKFVAASGGAALTSPESLRPIKIIVISDFLCAFCYICDKVLRDAIEACRDLPVRFDVEFRPFTLVNSSTPIADPTKVVYRNAYVTEKFGKEQAEIKLKAVNELSQKAGLKLSVFQVTITFFLMSRSFSAEDSIVCGTTQAHRLSAKAYRDGGQGLQNKLNTFIFDACLTKGVNINDEDLLVDAAVHIGLMSKVEATEFLHSSEYLGCVEKMVEAARAQGISGVPFVIIDSKWAVNGLQPVECFIQIFRKLAHLPVPSVPIKARTEGVQ
ncbi:thioredoxin-like protein [Lanmaoa asiatica]|nr:thioredoxin-like protein [Lanmaoa asiatica]